MEIILNFTWGVTRQWLHTNSRHKLSNGKLNSSFQSTSLGALSRSLSPNPVDGGFQFWLCVNSMAVPNNKTNRGGEKEEEMNYSRVLPWIRTICGHLNHTGKNDDAKCVFKPTRSRINFLGSDIIYHKYVILKRNNVQKREIYLVQAAASACAPQISVQHSAFAWSVEIRVEWETI